MRSSRFPLVLRTWPLSICASQKSYPRCRFGAGAPPFSPGCRFADLPLAAGAGGDGSATSSHVPTAAPNVLEEGPRGCGACFVAGATPLGMGACETGRAEAGAVASGADAAGFSTRAPFDFDGAAVADCGVAPVRGALSGVLSPLADRGLPADRGLLPLLRRRLNPPRHHAHLPAYGAREESKLRRCEGAFTGAARVFLIPGAAAAGATACATSLAVSVCARFAAARRGGRSAVGAAACATSLAISVSARFAAALRGGGAA